MSDKGYFGKSTIETHLYAKHLFFLLKVKDIISSTVDTSR